MQISDIFFICVLIAGIWAVVSAMVMASYVSKKGEKVNWLFIRLLIIKYIRQYYEITLKEDGKPGPWFYSYIVSINTALGMAILGIILYKVL